MSISKSQPMREAEIAAVDYINNELVGKLSGLDAVDANLQASINAEYTRAVNSENNLSNMVGDLMGKFPIKTSDLGDGQITATKLSDSVQDLLSFCETLPDFEFGYSDAQTIAKGSSVTVEIPFSKTFAEVPQVFLSVMCNTDLNVLNYFVKYATTSKAYVKIYNGGASAVSNLTVDYLAIAGR